MTYRVSFSPEAEEQLAALYNHIADVASPGIAKRYTDGIVSYCEKLHSFPIRGIVREDVRSGLRITNYKKRTAIAFEVDEVSKRVSILGLFYGGQDYETLLQDEQDAEDENNTPEE